MEKEIKKVLEKVKEVILNIQNNEYSQKDMDFLFEQFNPALLTGAKTRVNDNKINYKMKSKVTQSKDNITKLEFDEGISLAFIKIVEIIKSSKGETINKIINTVLKSRLWYEYTKEQDKFEMSCSELIVNDNADEKSGKDNTAINIQNNDKSLLEEKLLAFFGEGILKEIVRLRINGYNDSQIKKELNLYNSLFDSYIIQLNNLREEILEIINY
jgi:hypothetical protein